MRQVFTAPLLAAMALIVMTEGTPPTQAASPGTVRVSLETAGEQASGRARRGPPRWCSGGLRTLRPPASPPPLLDSTRRTLRALPKVWAST
jgi:hypothetical protein